MRLDPEGGGERAERNYRGYVGTENCVYLRVRVMERKWGGTWKKAIVATIPSGVGGETGRIYSLCEDSNTSTHRHAAAVTEFFCLF